MKRRLRMLLNSLATEANVECVGGNWLMNNQYRIGAHNNARAVQIMYVVRCVMHMYNLVSIGTLTCTLKTFVTLSYKFQNIHDTIVQISEYSLM